MKSRKIEPRFENTQNPRIGLIALATDLMIEKDFISVIKDRKIDFFVNRIECYNPLSKENLIKMSESITQVTKDILPDQKLDCVVYSCTSGTIAAGYDNIKNKVQADDKTIKGFNIGSNLGKVAGQSIMHCHIHLIPRREGDVDNPQGGVRAVIPAKQHYTRKK